MSEWNYIIAAYALTWIGILGYALHTARRLARAAARLNAADTDVRAPETKS